eukprot:5675256-Amphidinium_carterae.1
MMMMMMTQPALPISTHPRREDRMNNRSDKPDSLCGFECRCLGDYVNVVTCGSHGCYLAEVESNIEIDYTTGRQWVHQDSWVGATLFAWHL